MNSLAGIAGSMERRLRVVLSSMTAPGDVWTAARLVGMALIVPLLKYVLPLPTLVRLVRVSKRAIRRQRRREQWILGSIDAIYRRIPFLSRDNCLERSLVTYHFLSQAC